MLGWFQNILPREHKVFDVAKGLYRIVLEPL